ncbi:MAG: type II toxin-antitoxin system death-on-curing family toxin [Gammaproteobacteria bacterium]|jgi:death-on-curing protein|uniref:type II toxin-antitoxin system death-on-curing family toxin n=1 Tax=Nevskia sp. TaxID=1929292 RepID=UPI003F6F1277|nr:type II toxin-antitoxin system death-on-curing family toxin [Gammaproteobacteria bacterium]
MEFLDKDVVLAMHDHQLAAHGGASGVRDEGLLDSALARPQNKQAYGDDDPYSLAAAYAYGIARNHPFVDANKRTGLFAALLFLRMNRVPTPPPSPAMVEQMVLLAEGLLDEAGFAAWLAGQPRR